MPQCRELQSGPGPGPGPGGTGTGTGLKLSAGPGHYFFIKNSVIIYHIFYFAWTKNLQNQSFLSAISEKFYSEP